MTASLAGLAFRRATVEDAPALADVLVEGFETYLEFAPAQWRVPAVEDVADGLATQLALPTVWCVLAHDGSRVAGYIAWLPAADSRRPTSEPGLAHFWMLFVRVPWWGSGLADELHWRARDAAVRRGFSAMRLFTPADQLRARRFYERQGWRLSDEPFWDEDLTLTVAEYRYKMA